MRAAAFLACAALVGCSYVQTDTRVEKGPVLRTFERVTVEADAGVQAEVDARWPHVELSFSQFDRCRNETLEESLEDHITETSSPSAGPAIGTGVTLTAAGIGLLATQGLFPSTPNPRFIDASGHYGPSSRQLAQGWSVGLIIAGVPALAVGLLGVAQSGERTESRKSQSVVSAREAFCHQRPISGALEFPGGKKPPPPLPVSESKVQIDESLARKIDLAGFTLDGRPVLLPDDDELRLESYRACLAVLPAPDPEALRSLGAASLQTTIERARRCRQVPGAPVADVLASLEAELASRTPTVKQEEAVNPQASSFDEVKRRLAPRRAFNPQSTNLAELDDADSLAGQAVVLRGVAGTRVDADTVAFDIGSERIWLLLEKDAPWVDQIQTGSRLEVVGVVMGRQTVANKGSAPLIRAMWARPAL